jgi:hypothetical protein
LAQTVLPRRHRHMYTVLNDDSHIRNVVSSELLRVQRLALVPSLLGNWTGRIQGFLPNRRDGTSYKASTTSSRADDRRRVI